MTQDAGRRAQGAKAVTLIELIMVITIVGILTTAASMYIKETIDLWRFLTFRSEATAQARTALIRMAREIRQLKNNASIATADASRFRFTALDLNDDTLDDIVEFYRDAANNELRRIFNDTPALGDILANSITGLIFTYYNAAGGVPATLSDIYRINIELKINSGGQAKTLNVQVYPRNL